MCKFFSLLFSIIVLREKFQADIFLHNVIRDNVVKENQIIIIMCTLKVLRDFYVLVHCLMPTFREYCSSFHQGEKQPGTVYDIYWH